MAFTLCTSGAIVEKAGENANAAAAVSAAILEQLSNEAEAMLTAISKYDWVANFSGLNTNVQQFLAQVTSDYAGANLINYDKTSYDSVTEGENMIIFLRDNYLRGLSLLKDQDYVKFIQNL